MATGADLSFGCWVFISFAAFIHEELQLFIFKILHSFELVVCPCVRRSVRLVRTQAAPVWGAGDGLDG